MMLAAAGLLAGLLCSDVWSRSSDAPDSSIPREIRELWLRYHELELCQSLDAVFAFHDTGLEIWCKVEDERSYQRLGELVAPLRDTFTVELYATRPAPEKKSSDEKNPPPSLWNNEEIREFFQDPFAKNASNRPLSIQTVPPGERDSDHFLKQRMMMFAEQTLELGSMMKRYGADLPDLSRAGFGARADSELKERAAGAARSHASGMDKQAERLIENLAHALPKSTKRGRSPGNTASRRTANAKPEESAIQLADASRAIARRVHLFIHPQTHTVGLVDLKDPSLLESLRTLRRMVVEFQRAAQKSR